MAGPHRILRILAATVVLGLAAAPAAHANAFDTVYRGYKKDGRIDACAHSPAELKKAKAQVPNDIQQYAPDFPDALDAAAQQRASGSCADKAAGAGSATTTATAPATSTTTTPAAGAPAASTPAPATTAPAPASSAPATTPAPPASAQPAPPAQDNAINVAATTSKSSSGSGAPAAVILLGIIGALLLLGAIGYGVAHWWAWEPRWWPAARHAGAEAGWRASAAWAEFSDWVRLGR